MELNQANQLAEKFKNLLSPACDRIEIVGSVKRGDKSDVHDIEILMILNGRHPRPQFGDKVVHLSILDKIIYDLKQEGILTDPTKKANGPKYKKFVIREASPWNEFCLDLFIVTPETWGIQNVIRTGPSLFSHSFVTPQGVMFKDKETGGIYHGLLPTRFHYVREKTQIMEGDAVLELPEEIDVISLLGYGWIEPNKRHKLIRMAKS